MAMGSRMAFAVKFLISLLSAGEKPSAGVIRLATEAGISDGTFKRAARVIRIKSRKAKGHWYMSLPKDFSYSNIDWGERKKAQNDFRLQEPGAISSDFVRLVSEGTEIASLSPTSSVKLRIKVGAVEFEADEGFPPEKLLAIVRGLEAGVEC